MTILTIALATLTISIAGDSIANGTGKALCALIRQHEMPYECQVNAKDGILARGVIERVSSDADIVVISACTNDPNELHCWLALTAARVRASGRVIFIVPVYPAWAPQIVEQFAALHGDGIVRFTPGRGDLMKRVHPVSYSEVARDVLIEIVRKQCEARQ